MHNTTSAVSPYSSPVQAPIDSHSRISQLETPTGQMQEIAYLGTTPPFKPGIEGLIQIMTGPHRNFFTDMMAQALRLAGQGTPVLLVQFLKGGIDQGPDQPTCLGQHLDWLRCPLPRCIHTPTVDPEAIAALKRLWHHTQTVVYRNRYDLVVLDELSLAIQLGGISEAEVLQFLQTRPSQVDVILTGPDMPGSLLDIADQITELRRSYLP